MKHQIFLLLKERYEKDRTILSAGDLHENIPQSCSAKDWVEGIYLFDAYLNEHYSVETARTR